MTIQSVTGPILLRGLVLAISLTLIGCSTGVVPAGPQTYMISTTAFGLVPGGTAKAKAYREANDWCKQRGLVMVPVTSDSNDAVYGRKPAGAELVFRALPPGDPDIKRSTIERPDYIQRVQVR